jgi:predicted transcriptional regulator
MVNAANKKDFTAMTYCADEHKLAIKRLRARGRINYELQKRGHTQQSVALIAGCTQANVNLALSGKSNSPRVLEVLRALGVPEKYLFDPRQNTASAAKKITCEKEA